MKKAPIGTIILILIIVAIIFFGCINNENKKEEPFYTFKAEITSSTDSNYTILIPLVIDMEKETISPIMDNLTINGLAKIEYIDTVYGPALNVTGKGDIVLTINGKNKISPSLLSLLYDSDNDGRITDEYDMVKFWINLTSMESGTIHLKQNFDMRASGFNIRISSEGDIDKGLQKIDGTLIGGFK